MYWLSVIVVTTCLLVSTFGYPDGAPDIACKDLTPEHNSTNISNNSDNEYIITVTPGHEGQYYVVLGGSPFKGFVLQVDGGNLITQDDNSKEMNCQEVGLEAITHTNNTIKSAIVASWKPMKIGKFTFKATVVKDITAYVAGISTVFETSA